jgi:hypothetical protein
MKRLATYGLLTGLALAGWNYLEYLLGFHTDAVGRYTGFLAFFFTFGGITLGTKAYRNHDKGGIISYWEAVMAGVIITAVAALIFAGYIYLYYAHINPGFVDFLEAMRRQDLAAQQATASRIAASVRQLREYYQPGSLAGRTFGGFLAAGTIWTLVMAAILKRYPPE